MAGNLILFIVTSHGLLGDTGNPTGWYLPEVAHPYNVLAGANNGIVIASPLGGLTPMDPKSRNDPFCDQECLDFLSNPAAMGAMNNSIPLSKVNPDLFDAVFFPGGHGPMFDLVNHPEAHRITRKMWESGKVVSAVCHGPIGLANLKLSNGEFLVKGKKVTGFTNAEEKAVAMDKHVPVLLEDVLKANGGVFVGKEDWKEHVVVDGKLITGQNPASARLTGKKVLEALL